ncbi:uncharacterized protein LOC144158495 isoform X2 [Haemaphysalis longicornis]
MKLQMREYTVNASIGGIFLSNQVSFLPTYYYHISRDLQPELSVDQPWRSLAFAVTDAEERKRGHLCAHFPSKEPITLLKFERTGGVYSPKRSPGVRCSWCSASNHLHRRASSGKKEVLGLGPYDVGAGPGEQGLVYILSGYPWKAGRPTSLRL